MEPVFWDSIYSSDSSFFGNEPSVLAREALPFFEKYGCRNLLEFGCGQGRDTIFFARSGLKVTAIDYSAVSLSQLNDSAAKLGLGDSVTSVCVDLSMSLPETGAQKMDAIFAHLFFAMPFSDGELERLSEYAHNVLRHNGLLVFSIRSKEDASYGKGTNIGKDTYEVNGYKIRFFDQGGILGFFKQFRILKVKQAYEEPCSLLLVLLEKP